MKLALSAVLLLSFSALGSDDFARVTLEGVLIQSGERLVLRADGMAYDLNFNSAVVRDEAITLVGRNVRSSGKLNLKAKPGSTSSPNVSANVPSAFRTIPARCSTPRAMNPSSRNSTSIGRTD